VIKVVVSGQSLDSGSTKLVCTNCLLDLRAKSEDFTVLDGRREGTLYPLLKLRERNLVCHSGKVPGLWASCRLEIYLRWVVELRLAGLSFHEEDGHPTKGHGLTAAYGLEILVLIMLLLSIHMDTDRLSVVLGITFSSRQMANAW
jgi:hypothetical protein